MPTVYMCGPMAGYDGLNEPAFLAAGHSIWERGDEPLLPHDIMPHEHSGPCPKVYGDDRISDHDGGCYLRGDLAALLDRADSLYVLPGWSRSRGAQIEVLIARLLLIPIEFHPDAERGGSPVEKLAEIYGEIGRQDAKWGDQSQHPDGTGGGLDIIDADLVRKRCQKAFRKGRGTWRHILDEEVAEAYGAVGPRALAGELLQVAAVATQWAAAVERRLACRG